MSTEPECLHPVSAEQALQWCKTRPRVEVWSNTRPPMIMDWGRVIGYAPHPSLLLEHDDGTQAQWMISLGWRLCGEDLTIALDNSASVYEPRLDRPLAPDPRPVAQDTTEAQGPLQRAVSQLADDLDEIREVGALGPKRTIWLGAPTEEPGVVEIGTDAEELEHARSYIKRLHAMVSDLRSAHAAVLSALGLPADADPVEAIGRLKAEIQAVRDVCGIPDGEPADLATEVETSLALLAELRAERAGPLDPTTARYWAKEVCALFGIESDSGYLAHRLGAIYSWMVAVREAARLAEQARDEAQRLLRTSDEIRFAYERRHNALRAEVERIIAEHYSCECNAAVELEDALAGPPTAQPDGGSDG